MELTFKGKYIITGKLVLETGLHIGGATEGFEIGGLDKPVIRDPLTERPYIPGSSLKGKLRHLSEWSLNKIQIHPKHKGYGPHYCGECEACIIFGPASDDTRVREKAGPTRLTVRDAFPTDETVELWEKNLGERLFTEVKWENAIDRVTSEANPRPMERVPAGSEFQFEMVFDRYRDEDAQLLKSLFHAMHLLEDSALGGSGSRGHGRVKFVDIKVIERPVDFYLGKEGGEEKELVISEREPKKEFPEKATHHKFTSGLSGRIGYELSLPGHLAEKWEEILKG